MSRIGLPSMMVGSVQNVTFDFTSRLATSETISTQSVVASVYSGSDPTASAIVSGSATKSGAVVTQLISLAGKAAGVIYELLCTITTSAGQTLKMAAFLASIPPLP